MDLKALVVLRILMDNHRMTLYELSVKTKFSIREVRKALEDVEKLLKDRGLGLSHSRGYYQLSDVSHIEDLIDLVESEQLLLPKEVRLSLIYLYTFCRMDFVSNVHYQDFLKVSKNTTLSDIRSLREVLQCHHLRLEYSRSRGYQLKGEETDKHQLAFYMINQLLQSYFGEWGLDSILSSWGFSLKFELLDKWVQESICELQLVPIDDRLKECLYDIIFILCRYHRNVDRVELADVSPSKSIQACLTILVDNLQELGMIENTMTVKDKIYLSVILSSSFEGDSQEESPYFESITAEIIQNMEQIGLLSFHQQEELSLNLKRHLIPAYYRLKFGLPSSNDYTLRIKETYSELFELVKRALVPLERELGLTIPNNEIAYFVVCFGGYLDISETADRKKYRAVIVCPNGVSSALMIKENLVPLFLNVDFYKVSRVTQLRELSPDDYDLIFSTVYIESKKPTYLVSVLMTEEQMARLVDLVARDFPDIGRASLEVESLIAIIGRYATIHRAGELALALERYLRDVVKGKDVRPLLQDLLTEATYQRSSKVLEWKEAIRLAAQPLVESGKILPSYAEAMIQKVEEFGPFINLGKGIAIPHARPDEGVRQVGMSMLVLEHPIYLLDDPKQEIHLLICIAAVDNVSHLKALSHLTLILRDDEKVHTLLGSKTYQDIQSIIQQEV